MTRVISNLIHKELSIITPLQRSRQGSFVGPVCFLKLDVPATGRRSSSEHETNKKVCLLFLLTLPNYLFLPALTLDCLGVQKTEFALNNQPVRSVDISKFSSDQNLVYNIIERHYHTPNNEQLLLIITGVTGTGKSFVIDAVHNLLKEKYLTLAYFGIAAYNINANGSTLHKVLKSPTGSKLRAELKCETLQKLQKNLAGVEYIIIDEFSVVGQYILPM